MRGNVSGWYARLDRECMDRIEQMNIWLDAWEEALRTGLPQASQLPSNWPTLPASLLTDPGHVLDHLLCRHDAEADGRSPRGAHPTPTRLADAIIAEELKVDTPVQSTKDAPTDVNLSALPPAFRAQIEAKMAKERAENVEEVDEEAEKEIAEGRRTRTGIPLPFADPAVGGGLFPSCLLKWHGEKIGNIPLEQRSEDTRTLLSSLQLLDVCDVAAVATRRRLLLAAIRSNLVSLKDDDKPGLLNRSEAEEILQDVVRVGDALRGSWLWDDAPRLLMCNPPWLRIKDRFRGHVEGSRLRKELGEELRNLTEKDGRLRFSTLRGNVNLYRLFLERSLQLTQSSGRVRLIVPDSLLREQSSAPLRRLLVDKHEWTSIWTFPESARLFTGVTQGVLVLGITVNGMSEELICHGPAEANELCSKNGLLPTVPRFGLDRVRWGQWSRNEWSVPRLPRDRFERQNLLTVIDDLAELPRLAESHHWLAGEKRLRVRVGEVDQTTWSSDIKPWKKGSRGTPFIRGIHFRNDEEKGVWLHHPVFNSKIEVEASERKQAQWKGPIKAPNHPRLACQAIVNAQQSRRLRWVVLPKGCVLGNSVNHLELPEEVSDRLASQHDDLDTGLNWLCNLLNGDKLDAWARAWAANNNVNNYELEMLPLPPLEISVAKQLA
ncbi:MAG: hypothetical protein QF440_00730 [Candidatus Thalassarchaeaceae archaeon]|jgi:hypothetical protein|nr:hypothetical protein [Candidatus Thalassarchaeaceae archaeon]